jgi:amino acid adenylation domain-containing protein
VNFLISMARTPGLTAGDRLLAVTTLSFDISVLELLLPLITGAELIVAPADTVTDGAALAALLGASGATVMQATPSTWRLLLEAGWTGDGGLRIWCGGEALDPTLAARLIAAGGELWNLYGPTETTIWSTCARIDDAATGITVGRPIANTRVWVVDDHLRPVPVGVPGELLIGGDGLSCGYHARDALTAAKFVRLPGRGERVYRTGDRARWRRDGQLELLGRTDAQVKLRGFRIEPGEIEAVLCAHPGVAAAVVGVRRAPPGDARLVAWVTSTGAELDPGLLRTHLRQSLPDYMLPGAWVMLAALPLTPNGKVDRRALPAPDWRVEVAGGGAARTPLEGLVCELFGAVLGRPGVGVGDDFFALGGHSLLATQLVSRLRDALGVEVPLRRVFEGPTPAAIAATVQQADAAPPIIPMAEHDAPGAAPMSVAQRRLWFLAQLEPESTAYHLHVTLRLTGALDRAALQVAVDAVLRRHAALRTVFEDADGELLQHVQEPPTLPICWLPGSDDDALAACVETPFDLARGPLWRVVVAGGGEVHVLVVVVHHIVADGWSMGVLFGDLATAYNAARRGAAATLAPLPLQYTDYARWQHARLAAGELERQLAYWRRQLAGAPPALPLPTDRPRPPVQAHRGAWAECRLDAALRDACHRLARETGCTLFMVLAGALAAVLGRLAGTTDVLLGTPVAGRGRTELEGLVGFFVNTLVLRVDLGGNPAFRALLARVRRTALDAYAHPDLPFEQLVEVLNPPRDRSRNPLVQVLIALHNQPRPAYQFDALSSVVEPKDSDAAKFDLSVHAAEEVDGLVLAFNYDAALFDRDTVDEVAHALRDLLRVMTADADTRPGDWLLPAPGVAGVLPVPGGWLGTDVWTVFAAVVARSPKALAVVAGSRRWSYGALAALAGGVARGLLAAGVVPGDRVALLAGHDGVAVAGLLGILRAGAAYVVLDGRDPPARQRAVCAALAVGVVVSDAAHAAAALGLPVVALDPQADGEVPAAVAVGREDLAYVLPTSGTTGVPKGVMQSHGGLLAQVGRYAASLGLGPGDRLSGLSGLGFDAAVQDVFGALLSGASLHLVDLRDGRGAAAQVESLAAAGVTVVHATPTVYRYLFGGELDCRHELGTVRAVVLGGEVARRSDFELFRARFGAGAVLVNGYGLTECTVGLQWWADRATVVRGDELPLGRAVGELAVRLVDESGGESWLGEIELAGPGLAAGYWGDAGLTAARFVADANAPGGRWYRTGDWGWRRPDGTLGYLGRRDTQVKLQGRRVELGEVEAALECCPGVVACAVGLRPSAAGPAQLVAWYVPAAGGVTPAGLRAALGGVLPAALVPAAWVEVAELPRRANGKVAREQLPAPGRARVATGPRSQLEQRLAAIWAGLLGLDTVAVTEDFFALGGHSLLATRLVARLRAELGVEIPLLAVFEHPTVSGLAQVLATMPGQGESSGLPELAPMARHYQTRWPEPAAKGE